jgi:hypothetical protein
VNVNAPRRTSAQIGVALLLATLGPAIPRIAAAQPRPEVLWLGDDANAADRAASLAVEVAPRGVNVSLHVAPLGSSLADRIESARRFVGDRGAIAGVWIEGELAAGLAVYAVSPAFDGALWAPLSDGADDSRTVGMISASVVGELAEAGMGGPAGGANALALASPLAAWAPRSRDDARDLAAPWDGDGVARAQRRDPFLELGAVIAGVAYGAELGGGLYLTPSLRLDLRARLTYVILSARAGGVVSSSLGYVTDDDDGRFEIGGELGVLLVEDGNCRDGCIPIQTGFAGGGFAGFSWGPWDDGRIGVRLSAIAALIEGDVVPSAVLDLYVQVMP